MSVFPGPALSPPDRPAPSRRQEPRRWRDKFREALRGLKFGVRGQSSFFVHFFFAALVIAAALVLRCPLVPEGCILLGCIALVLVAELFNTAVETLFRGLDAEARERVWPCLDIAAGAVLLASAFAALIGGLVFLRLLSLL